MVMADLTKTDFGQSVLGQSVLGQSFYDVCVVVNVVVLLWCWVLSVCCCQCGVVNVLCSCVLVFSCSWVFGVGAGVVLLTLHSPLAPDPFTLGYDLLWPSLLWPRPGQLWPRPWVDRFWPIWPRRGRFWWPRLANFGHLRCLGHGLSDLWWPARFWSGQANLGQFCPPSLAWPILGSGLADFSQWVAWPIEANGPLPRFGPPPVRTALRRTTLRRTALRQTALRRTTQHFALFFLLPLRFSFFFSLSGDVLVSSCLSPGVFSCLSSSLWRSSRGILVLFWSQMCLFSPWVVV